jgi:hypothetical protein
MHVAFPQLSVRGSSQGLACSEVIPSLLRRPDHISPLDDLAFDMYQDPDVAQIIRKLDERKREAVQKERYDHAKKLKQAIADLQKVLL